MTRKHSQGEVADRPEAVQRHTRRGAMHSPATNRSVSQVLSAAGFENARVRHNPDCSYRIPSGASGYACAEMVVGPWSGCEHRWPGVEVSWYGNSDAPFEAITSSLEAKGYVVGGVGTESYNTGRPSLVTWRSGADKCTRQRCAGLHECEI